MHIKESKRVVVEILQPTEILLDGSSRLICLSSQELESILDLPILYRRNFIAEEFFHTSLIQVIKSILMTGYRMLSQNQRKLIIFFIQRIFIYSLQICHSVTLVTDIESLNTRFKQATSIIILLISLFPNIKEVFTSSLLLSHFSEATQMVVRLQVFIIIYQGNDMIDIFKTMNLFTVFLIFWIIGRIKTQIFSPAISIEITE